MQIVAQENSLKGILWQSEIHPVAVCHPTAIWKSSRANLIFIQSRSDDKSVDTANINCVTWCLIQHTENIFELSCSSFPTINAPNYIYILLKIC